MSESAILSHPFTALPWSSNNLCGENCVFHCFSSPSFMAISANGGILLFNEWILRELDFSFDRWFICTYNICWKLFSPSFVTICLWKRDIGMIPALMPASQPGKMVFMARFTKGWIHIYTVINHFAVSLLRLDVRDRPAAAVYIFLLCFVRRWHVNTLENFFNHLSKLLELCNAYWGLILRRSSALFSATALLSFVRKRECCSFFMNKKSFPPQICFIL